jgi:general stress protein YciG
MANTKLGGQTYINTMIKKHGSHEAYRQHMREIAAMGGKKGGVKGFASSIARAKSAGAKGGRISKRKPREA